MKSASSVFNLYVVAFFVVSQATSDPCHFDANPRHSLWIRLISLIVQGHISVLVILLWNCKVCRTLAGAT